MKKLFVLTLVTYLFSTISVFAQDTFSILAIDTLTGEIGAAGATCSDGIAGYDGVRIINQIIPGKGAVNAQAWICARPNINLDYAIGQINLNRQAQEVLDSLLNNDQCSAQDFNVDFRQYGIITVDSTKSNHLVAFTGTKATDVKDEKIGANYVIIGNNLTSEAVLDSMESRFLKQEGTLADKLLAAMHGGKSAGGDSRCTDRGTSSTSTFLRVAKPDDEFLSPSIYINIPGVPMGVEPIDSLQALYDDSMVGIENNQEVFQGLNILFSPINDDLFFNINLIDFSSFDVAVYNLSGIMVFNQTITQNQAMYKVNLPELSNGSYLLSVKTKSGYAGKKFQVIK